MAGRIRDEDVTLVKERLDIADVVGESVTLRSAGAGRMKGLCPFHDEKTPSFTVNRTLGFFYCFGCQARGDAISFVMDTEHLTFAEAVERLAIKAGIQLRYEDGAGPGLHTGQRTRLVDAHVAAAAFFEESLGSEEGVVARQFLDERGFDRAAAHRFGVGYAPRGWTALVDHLHGKGFRDQELIAGGLARQGQRGPVDTFRGRLVFPVRDLSGDVVGFGARLLHEDDGGPKYLNTAETPIYKKSTMLYGLDVAKKDIAKARRAVVVEGYTDVMACHLAGVPTAVATCGTAFGDGHIKVLRRLLVDDDAFVGEVVFTFDGDEAGQKAALKAFAEDQKFVSRTFVAVEPSGMDPCELRQHKGDAAVVDLVEARVPLFEFAIRSAVARHDLSTPDGRVAALAAAAPVVAGIRDPALRPEYARQLAGWLGMEVEAVRRAVASAGRRPTGGGGGQRSGRRDAPPTGPQTGGSPAGTDAGTASSGGADRDVGDHLPPAPEAEPAPEPPRWRRPDPRDPVLLVEREALKLALQQPELVGQGFDELPVGSFTAPVYAAMTAGIARAGGCAGAKAGPSWLGAVLAAVGDETLRVLVTELAVESPRLAGGSGGGSDGRYGTQLVAALEEALVKRRKAELYSGLQRVEGAAADTPEYAEWTRLQTELLLLEQRRRLLQERALGPQ